MTSYVCPNCDRPLRPENVAEGWCDECGKRLPARLSEQAAREQRRLARRLSSGGAVSIAEHGPLSPDVVAVRPTEEEVSPAERPQAVARPPLAPRFPLASALVGLFRQLAVIFGLLFL